MRQCQLNAMFAINYNQTQLIDRKNDYFLLLIIIIKKRHKISKIYYLPVYVFEFLANFVKDFKQ